MRLLFDHNLSHKLVSRLADLFPGSTQTRLVGLGVAADFQIWEYAKRQGFIVVTMDADFYDISLLHGHPPKLIWLRCGNSAVVEVEKLLRTNVAAIESFVRESSSACLEIF